jgi:hypothetical protein
VNPGDRCKITLADGREFVGFLRSYTTDYEHMSCQTHMTLEMSITDEAMARANREPIHRPRPGAYVTINTDRPRIPSDHWNHGFTHGRPRKKIINEANCARALYPEVQMDKYEAIIIRDRESKRAKVYMLIKGKTSADGNEVYLTADGKEVERAPGSEMPLYTTMPDELFIPLTRAVQSSPDYSTLYS